MAQARTIRVSRVDDLIRIVIEHNGAAAHHVPVQRLYDLKATAIYLGRPVSSVRQLIHNGDLPSIKGGRGGKQFVDIHDLEAYIEREKVHEIPLSSSRRQL